VLDGLIDVGFVCEVEVCFYDVYERFYGYCYCDDFG